MSDDPKDTSGDIAEGLMRGEDWHGAIEAFLKEPELLSLRYDRCWNLGWAYFKSGDLQNAEKYFRESLRLAPSEAVTFWALGVVLKDKGDVEDAEAAFLKALSIRDGSMPRLSLAILYMEQGKLEKAEEVHLQGIQLSPNSQQRLLAYGDFLSDVGRTEEAEAVYAKAKVAISK